MSENLRNYTKAIYAFDHVLNMADDSAFTSPSPCDGWTGTDVYEHVMGNLKMIQAFATTGKPPKAQPKMGKDPFGAWAKQRDQTLEALDHPDVLHSVAKDPFGPEMGPMPIDMLVGFMAADLTVHTWDMARTAQVDEHLDPALVKYAMAQWKPLPEGVLRSPGMMGPKVRSAAGADAQTKLLNLLGRTV